jgi:hypothetical protein
MVNGESFAFVTAIMPRWANWQFFTVNYALRTKPDDVETRQELRKFAKFNQLDYGRDYHTRRKESEFYRRDYRGKSEIGQV